MPTNLPNYVLVTAARNEAAFIEETLKSVVAQTVRPLRWVIVSDGSTDGTDDIVRKYAADHPWIELLRMPERQERHFAGKVYAFNAGYARVKDLAFEVIGNLDADLSFDESYFEFLMARFAESPRLGVAGTAYRQGNVICDNRFSIEDVPGACQLFRRECFEEIGGYIPVKAGGVDFIAVLTARTKGWKTKTFTGIVSLHHRNSGTAQRGRFMAKFHEGVKDYALGGHPLWAFIRAGYQMANRPFVAGGLTLAAGYFWALARRVESPMSCELVAFRRREQMQRLKGLVRGAPICGKPASQSQNLSGARLPQ